MELGLHRRYNVEMKFPNEVNAAMKLLYEVNAAMKLLYVSGRFVPTFKGNRYDTTY
jgi:hypothetical protein